MRRAWVALACCLITGACAPATNRHTGLQLTDDPCLYWLSDLHRAAESRRAAAAAGTDLPALQLPPTPDICPHYEDLYILTALLRLENPDGMPDAVRGIYDRLRRPAVRSLAQSLVTATTRLPSALEDQRQSAARLLALRTWQASEAQQAVALLQLRAHEGLSQRLLVDAPHLAPTLEWEKSLEAPTFERLLRDLSQTQAHTRMRNLAEARLTRRMAVSLDAGLFRGQLGTQHYWRGRIEFIEREYTKALQHLRLSDQSGGVGPRERALWIGRTLARLSRPDEAESTLLSVGGPWDSLRCDAWFRVALLKGYATDYVAQRQVLEQAASQCARGDHSTTDIAWELWKNELATQDYGAARSTLRKYGDSFVAENLLRATERAFWLCYLAQPGPACSTDPTLASDPFLPYREALAPGTRPSLIMAEDDTQVTLDTFDAMLLRDLRLVGWDALYFGLLEDLYRQQPWGALEELYISALAHQQSIHAAIKRIERELPRERTMRWMHMVLLYPYAYRDTVERASVEYGVERALPWAIMREESRYLPTARSWVGAEGLMQLMPYTAKRLDNRNLLYTGTLYDPQVNIPLGTRYLAQLMQRYQNPVWAIAAYNAGEEAVDTWLTRYRGLPTAVAMELIPYTETRQYVKKVLRSLLVYRFRLGEPQGQSPMPDTSTTAWMPTQGPALQQ